MADREITRVDDVVGRLGFNKRTLQRLFSRYVGVSPKWVIKRYRLHEAAEQLASGEAADLSRMALDLGYFDQAHFIKDFKSIVGKSPAEYAKSIGASRLVERPVILPWACSASLEAVDNLRPWL